MVLSLNDPELLNTVSAVIDRGGIVIIPCDTIYGFVGRYPETDSKIRAVKGREETKPFIVLAVREQLNKLTDQEIPPYLTRHWPGPLTLIMRKRELDETIAVRVPDNVLLQEIIGKVGTPVFSTSVNRSGNPPMNMIADIIQEFEAEVDLIIDGGDLPKGAPSTIVDISKTPHRIIRQGALQINPV